MTNEKFQDMVSRLEILARKNMRGYKLRVGLLAGLGFGYYLVVMLIFAFLTLLLLRVRVFWPALLSLYCLILSVKALFVRFSPPQGIELTPKNAPALFDLLRELHKDLRLPPLKKVILDEDFNAYVMQIPKWFLIGPTNRYLVLGLPMMDSLSVDQFKATLGHELGHLSGNHAAFSNWIYRVRAMYARLLYSLGESRSFANYFIRLFLKRYVPYFDAYSFVLARDNEYDADSIAAQTTSNEIAASGLVTIHVLGRQMSNDFWPMIFKEAASTPEPPSDISARIKHNFLHYKTDETATLIHENFRTTPSPYASHPSLAARLQSLGFTANCPEDVIHLFQKVELTDKSAAAKLLGSSYQELASQINERWSNLMREAWHARRKAVEEATEFSKRFDDSIDLNAYEGLQRIQYLIIQGKDEEAENALQDYLVRPDALTTGNFYLGYLMLKRKDDNGLEHLKKLTPDDGAECLSNALEHARNFLLDEGRDGDFDNFLDEMEPIYAKAVELDNKRFELSKKSQFKTHTLTPEQLVTLEAMLNTIPMLKSVWIVTKVVEGRPLHLILFERQSRFLELNSSRKDEKFAAGINVDLPVPSQMVVHMSSHSWLRSRLKKMQGSQVFPVNSTA